MRSHAKAPSAGSKLRRPWAVHLALLCAAALLLAALFAAPAHAAPETIAGPGTGAGQVLTPRGTAVHQATGDLYVADYNFLGTAGGSVARISKFDSEGDFLLAWGWGVADASDEFQTCGPEATPPQAHCVEVPNSSTASGPGAVNAEAVAVDQATGAVYAADSLNLRVSKFTSSGEFVFMVGKNVNETKVADGGATQAEKDICTAASGDTCGKGESGSAANEFSNPLSIDVDSSGVVWVGDTDRIASFDSSGVPGAEIALAGAGETQSLALDSSGNFYVKSEALPGIRKLEAGTGALLATFDEGGDARTVTLDAAGNVYVGDATSPYRFMKFNPAGEQILQFGAGEVIGVPEGNALAIGESADRLYVASSRADPESARVVQAFPLPEPGPLVEKQGVEDILPTTATLTARINPENDETSYRFEYGTSDSYGESTPSQTLAAGFDPQDVEAGIEGLIPDTTYHFRVVATNHCNPSEPAEVCTAEGEDQTFTTLPAIDILAQWATDITATTAELHAEMDPLGVEAEAWLEWGTDESYGQVVPLANLGDGFGPVARETFLAGLAPGTTYHYRFVARDERDGNQYTVQGADKTFTTQVSALGFELADDRAWEMVSPPDKHGARLFSATGQTHIQASADGNALAYQSLLSTEAEPEGNRFQETSMNLARRNADGSWRSKDITPPNDHASGITLGNGYEYKLFSADLSEALLEPRSGTPLSPEASERTPYLRQNTEPHRFRPLVTGKEPFANVAPGTEFGGDNTAGAVRLAGASPDFRHFALASEVPLVEGAPASGGSLYLWSDGQLEPIGVLPAGEGGAIVNGRSGSGSGSVRGAVSQDGSRVFWSSLASGNITALYVRDTEADESGRLDVVQSGPGIGTARPTFQGASADGSVVFFTDSQQLTEDASDEGFDLYRCELPPGSIASGCATLTDISVPTTDGEDAEVQDIAAAIGPDGEAIYFVAKGVLDEVPNEAGEGAVSGEPNLYLWRDGEGVRFIATLHPVKDRGTWGEGKKADPNGTAAGLSATASPSGRYLAFMSQRILTGYDSRDANTGEPAQEVFRYDSLTDSLQCVSCSPTGASPDSATPQAGSPVDPAILWGDLRAAATLPQAVLLSTSSGISLYRPRAVLDNGRVFFNAIDSLVTADSNAQWDVYQYEPTGVGDCTSSSGGASISRSAGGCVSLISSGTAEEEAAFLDASVSGDDAFFWTPAQLNETDTDHEVDVYDARVNGIPATFPEINECLGEACQPAARVPDDPTPASAGFRGEGDAKPPARKRCAKGKRAVRRGGKSRCVPRKQKRQGAKRKANRNRGARR